MGCARGSLNDGRFRVSLNRMTTTRTLAWAAGTLAAALSVAAVSGTSRQQAPAPEITVYKGPT